TQEIGVEFAKFFFGRDRQDQQIADRGFRHSDLGFGARHEQNTQEPRCSAGERVVSGSGRLAKRRRARKAE
ncbi:MAG TPA: hypothetical protein P5068_19010, partial [Sedimentisphaerales bacterium]|nr:hypothetical protein [Sedimentisphaerales bacterium]HRV49856.1 hypothetical protein [Sedimentisphaerales bacterium]